MRGQSVFYASQFSLAGGSEWERENRLGLAYLHGRPGTPGMPEFDTCYELVRRPTRRDRPDPGPRRGRWRSSCSAPASRARRCFASRSASTSTGSGCAATRSGARRGDGSDCRPTRSSPARWQKDGVGWRDGLEPKLIKGPDILLGAVERLRELVPELYVLLTGPARGYVIQGLERAGVAFRHVLLEGPRRRSTRLRGARRVPRDLARRGGAEGGARVDGAGRAARDDEGRPGRGSRP